MNCRSKVNYRIKFGLVSQQLAAGRPKFYPASHSQSTIDFQLQLICTLSGPISGENSAINNGIVLLKSTVYEKPTTSNRFLLLILNLLFYLTVKSTFTFSFWSWFDKLVANQIWQRKLWLTEDFWYKWRYLGGCRDELCSLFNYQSVIFNYLLQYSIGYILCT